jgi:hypothetical protein
MIPAVQGLCEIMPTCDDMAQFWQNVILHIKYCTNTTKCSCHASQLEKNYILKFALNQKKISEPWDLIFFQKFRALGRNSTVYSIGRSQTLQTLLFVPL